VLPGIIDNLEAELTRLGMPNERISVHMTGCPNGCARPYTPEIGLVGKTVGKYTILVGGNTEGTRLNFIYKDLVPLEDIVPTLAPLLARFKAERQNSESFGDFATRVTTPSPPSRRLHNLPSRWPPSVLHPNSFSHSW
jgi:sulfite reductase (ferredoxin)